MQKTWATLPVALSRPRRRGTDGLVVRGDNAGAVGNWSAECGVHSALAPPTAHAAHCSLLTVSPQTLPLVDSTQQQLQHDRRAELRHSICSESERAGRHSSLTRASPGTACQILPGLFCKNAPCMIHAVRCFALQLLCWGQQYPPSALGFRV
jgi:hypothetical protein